jgi:lysophospholipase L1-like esterase
MVRQSVLAFLPYKERSAGNCCRAEENSAIFNSQGIQMTIRLFAITMILCIVAAQAVCAQGNNVPPARLRDVHRIVCLGDSITQGGEAPGGYVWLVRRYLTALYPDIEVINAGISGHKSTDMLERFQRDVIDKKPQMVTISVGVNDVWHGFYDNHPEGDGPRGVKLEDYRKNVEEMIRRAADAKIKVVLLSTTVIHENLENRENAKLVGYNAALRDLARSHNGHFIDFQKPFAALIRAYRSTGARDNLLTADGVHMNGLGNKVMAYTILTGLDVPAELREGVREAAEKR